MGGRDTQCLCCAWRAMQRHVNVEAAMFNLLVMVPVNRRSKGQSTGMVADSLRDSTSKTLTWG